MKKSILSKHIKIEQYENFQKMSFRNRYIVSGANGLLSLTIPVKGGRDQKVAIKDVVINNEIDWKSIHWKGLLSSYSKAPYFEFYVADLKELLFSEEEYLFVLNIKILGWVYNVLKVNVKVGFTEEFLESYEGDSDYRNRFLPKSFQNNTENWKPRYPQVFEDRVGFQPNLSIIDLLFCEGPNAINLLTQSL